MNKIHVFEESLKIGEYGEEIIYNYLKKSPVVDSIIDVRNSRMYQEVDVDLIAKMKNGEELKIEIKTDTYKSGNIYYETISALETDSLGGFQKTECDYMFYYFLNLDTLYIIEMDKYKKWFESKEEEFKNKGYQKRPINKRWNNGTYTSVGYAFPTQYIDNPSIEWVWKEYINQNDWI